MNKVLILGATGNQVSMVKTAQQMGLYTITMDWNLKNIAHRYSDESVQMDITDKNAVLEWVKQHNIRGIATCASDLTLQTQAFICDKLNLNGPDTESVTRIVNKGNFREFQKKNKLPHPNFFIFSDRREVVKTIKSLSEKYIIKPIDSSGSKGLFVLDQPFNVGTKELEEIIDNAFHFSHSGQVIVEEFLAGRDYTIEGFYKDGKIEHFILTEKELIEHPYRTPIGHLSPAPIFEKFYDNLRSLVENYMVRLNIGTTPFDMDLIIRRDRSVYIIEMSPRIGGNMLPNIMLHSTGYDLCKSALSYALNLVYNEKPTKNELVIGRLIRSDINGVIKNIAEKNFLLEKFKPHLKELEYDFNVGDRASRFKQGDHRLGHFIVRGENREQIKKICQDIEREIKLIVKPED